VIKSPDGNMTLAQGISFRISLREETRLQAEFLKRLSVSDAYQNFVLCGGAALHGVYLHRRRSKKLDLYASAAMVARFQEIAQASGVEIEPTRVANSYLIAARSNVQRDLRVGVRVAVQPNNFQRRELSTFTGFSSGDVSVNVLPLADLFVQKLLLVAQRHSAVDVLDLWLALRDRPDIKDTMRHLLRVNPSALGPQIFSVDLIVARLKSFKGLWKESLKGVVYPVPEFDEVHRDLQSWLSAFRTIR